MVMRILVGLGLIVLMGGFIFFSANVIWLGTKAFFAKYGPSSKTTEKKKAKGKTLIVEDSSTESAQ